MEKLKITLVLCVLFFTIHVEGQSTVEKLGDYSLYSLPLITFTTTLIKKDIKGTSMFGKAFLLNGVVTYGLKRIIDKERPNKENLNSFPSGHTSITFQSAAFLQKRYGWKYGIPAYTIAAYTGFSRVHVKKHFVEDVLAGAAIGVLSSYIFTKKRTKKNNKSFSFDKKGKDLFISYSCQF